MVFSGTNVLNLNQKGQIVFIGGTNFNLIFGLPFFYNGTSVQNLAQNLSPSSVITEIAINDSGQVAFGGCQAIGSLGACLQPSVYMFNGSVNNIFIDNVTSERIVNLSINSRGHLSWSSSDFGIRFFAGTSVRDLTNDPSAKGAGYRSFVLPTLSNGDQVLFLATQPTEAVFYFDGLTLKNITTNDPSVGVAGFNSFTTTGLIFALNDAGRAAFAAAKSGVFGSTEVFYFDGTAITNLTETDSAAGGAGFNFFGLPGLNSAGVLSFAANKFVEDTGAVFVFDGASLKNITQGSGMIPVFGSLTKPNSSGHLACSGKDQFTSACRLLDIFFYDGSAIQNLTGNNSVFADRVFFGGQDTLRFNNNDQVAALMLNGCGTNSSTNDVFLFSPSSFPIPPKVLEPQQQPQYGTIPQPSPQARGLVLITHGWRDNVLTWVEEMKNNITQQIDHSNSNIKWHVVSYDWSSEALTLFPWDAVVNAEGQGKKLSETFPWAQFNYLHFIAHSAGSKVIETAAFEIRRRSGAVVPCNPDLSGPVIQTTFLDAYDPNGGTSDYGRCSTYAEQYVDKRTVVNKLVDDTDIDLNFAFNFDVTDLDPNQLNIPVLDATHVHAWPHVWYNCSVNPPDPNCQQSDFGFPISIESGKLTLPSHNFINFSEPYFPRGYSCTLSRNTSQKLTDCGQTERKSLPTRHFAQNNPLDLSATLTTNQLLASNTGSFNFPTPNSLLMATGSPIWVSVLLKVNSFINALQFDYQFLSNAEGLLSVFFDNQVVFKADERITPLGVNSSHDVWTGDINPGDHVLSFRLDGFSGMQSLVQLSNIRTGVLSISQLPVTKQLTSLGPAKLWVGLKNSDDQVTFFDVRVDVLKNGSVIASGVSKNIQGVTCNPDQAKEVTVGFGTISNGELSSGDTLSLRVLAKVADSGGHNNAVGLRLYYDAVSRPSRFGTEITPDPSKSFFLHTAAGDILNSTSPTGTTPKQKDSPSVDRKTFKEIATWSMTVP